jgi:hypothetical protein
MIGQDYRNVQNQQGVSSHFHSVKFNSLLIRGVLPLDDQPNQRLIFDPCQAEYGKEYHSPPWRPPDKGTWTSQDTSTSQCSPYSPSGDVCNSEQVDSPDIGPVVDYSIDHENQSPPYFIPDYGEMEMKDQSVQELFSVKTEPSDGPPQDIPQLLHGVSDCDHNFPVDQYPPCMDSGISVDNLDSSNGYLVTIVDEAIGSSGVPLAQQEAFDNQERPPPNNTDIFNSFFHEKHSQIDHSFHAGISFNNDPIRYIQEEQSPVDDSFGIMSPSSELVLLDINVLIPLFNKLDESPFTVLNFSCSGDGILLNESAEHQYGYSANGFPTATCPSHRVPCAPVKCSAEVLPDPSSPRGLSEFSLSSFCSSPISITSDQATVSIKLRKTSFQLG